MSSGGRGRGYTGRHNTRARPGDQVDDEPARSLAELSPRATDRETRDNRSQETRDMPRERKISHQEREIIEPETADLLDNISSEDDAVLKELLYIDEQYQPLLVLLEQFSPSEDGIQFNRKLRNFETSITNICPDENRLQAAFATFRAAALRNPVTARKLAGVGASFTRQQRQQLLRTTLLNVIMQGTFSKLDILERANPLFLINAANLMGDYFSEARLCNGNKVHILASPLLQYMKALLTSDDVRAHRSLATQLMQNGRELLAVQQTETEELTIKIRLRLLTPPPCGIVWLLLSSDMALNKFLPLPNCLQQFYASNLKLTSDSDYSEVSYGSWKKSTDDKSDDSSNLSQNLSNISLTDEDGSSKPKLRPILGAGAGLLRQQPTVNQDTFDWTSKTNLAKRYDLNSWRQEGEKDEPVFDPSVLPPPLVPPNLPRNFSEYPPPNFNFKEHYNNYLQQGDGHYIQNQYNYDTYQGQEETEYSEQALSDRAFPELPIPDRTYQETAQYSEHFEEIPERATIADFEDRTTAPDNNKITDKVNNEIQKSSRKPVENWRREKSDLKEEAVKPWTRQKSKDSVSDDDKSVRSRVPQRLNRRNSGEPDKSPPRRHVSDVPRNHKYWDHDDRCDKDY